ncbi:MAG: hypothetical protein M0R51_17655 [Clostridia bacterium]|jgi:hypothetical protein|nr:hypothetical protein [Clostridia bacterium]
MISTIPDDDEGYSISEYDDRGVVTCIHCGNISTILLWEEAEACFSICPICKRRSTLNNENVPPCHHDA